MNTESYGDKGRSVKSDLKREKPQARNRKNKTLVLATGTTFLVSSHQVIPGGHTRVNKPPL